MKLYVRIKDWRLTLAILIRFSNQRGGSALQWSNRLFSIAESGKYVTYGTEMYGDEGWMPVCTAEKEWKAILRILKEECDEDISQAWFQEFSEDIIRKAKAFKLIKRTREQYPNENLMPQNTYWDMARAWGNYRGAMFDFYLGTQDIQITNQVDIDNSDVFYEL